MGSGSHACATFGDDAELTARVAPFLRAAVAARRRVLYVVDRPVEQLREHVATLPDADALIARGALVLIPWGTVYEADAPADMRARLAGYQAQLDAALADRFTGLAVVADGTPVYSVPELVPSNRRWELVVDRWIATRPVDALCVTDRRRVPADVAESIACLHRASDADVPFRVNGGGEGARLAGEVDGFSAERFGQLLADLGPEAGALDLSGARFLDHHALLALREHARREGEVVVTGAPPEARRVWDVLGLGAGAGDAVRWA